MNGATLLRFFLGKKCRGGNISNWHQIWCSVDFFEKQLTENAIEYINVLDETGNIMPCPINKNLRSGRYGFEDYDEFVESLYLKSFVELKHIKLNEKDNSWDDYFKQTSEAIKRRTKIIVDKKLVVYRI